MVLFSIKKKKKLYVLWEYLKPCIARILNWYKYKGKKRGSSRNRNRNRKQIGFHSAHRRAFHSQEKEIESTSERRGFHSMAPEADHDIKDDDEKNPRPLDEDDIALLKTYVIFPSFPFSFFLSFLLQTLITTMWISLFIFSSIH